MQWRIQDFPDRGAPTPKMLMKSILFGKISAENCMKMKEIGQEGERLPSAHFGSANEAEKM